MHHKPHSHLRQAAASYAITLSAVGLLAHSICSNSDTTVPLVRAQMYGDVASQKTYVTSAAPLPVMGEMVATVLRGFAVLAFDTQIHTGIIVLVGIFLASPTLAMYSFVSGFFGVLFNLATGAPRPTITPTGPDTKPSADTQTAADASGVNGAGVITTGAPAAAGGRGGIFPRPSRPGGVPGRGGRAAPATSTDAPSPFTAGGDAAGVPAAESALAVWPGLYSGYGVVDSIYAGMISGMFWMPGARTILLAMFTGMVSAMIRTALSNIFYVWGLPTLALPFCLATMPLLLNHKFLPVFRAIPLAMLTTPEDHLNRNRTVRETVSSLRLQQHLASQPHIQLQAEKPSSQKVEKYRISPARPASDRVALRVRAALSCVAVPATDRGMISRDTLARILSVLGTLPSSITAWNEVDSAAQKELNVWFEAADFHRRGLVATDDVIDMVVDAVLCSRVEARATKFFRVTGHATLGYMTRGQFREAIFQAGEKLTWEEEAAVFRRADALHINGVYILLDVMTKGDLIDALLPGHAIVSSSSTSLS